SVTFQVTVTASNSKTGTATLSISSGLPSGATYLFSPASVTISTSGGSANSTLTITTAAQTPSGAASTFTVATSDNGVTQTGNLTVNARPITVTATANTKTYDGTTSATATPTITGTLASGDTATLTEAYINKNAGPGKTLIPTAVIKNASNVDVTANYNINYANNTSGVINSIAITVSAATNSKT